VVPSRAAAPASAQARVVLQAVAPALAPVELPVLVPARARVGAEAVPAEVGALAPAAQVWVEL
jgi:hypothetical protein